MSFVNPASNGYSALVSVIIYVISYNIGPCDNSTGQYCIACKMTSSLVQYKHAILPLSKSHCADKTILQASYLQNGISYTGKMTYSYWIRGHFKNPYELLNLRALKISMLYKIHIFQSIGKIFCVEFQRVPLKFHTKYLTHTLKDVDFIHRWKFKSS